MIETSQIAQHSSTPKLHVQNLYKVFGETPEHALKLSDKNTSKDDIFKTTGNTVAVNDVNLSVFEGEIFVVMGLSGSGKSTLIRLLNRLIEPSRGHVFIDGDDIVAMSKKTLRETRRKKISMVFQSFALMPHLTTLQNTAFGLDLAGASNKEKQEKAMQALAQVGLDAYAHSYPDELSGGMQQRVGLARALANDPDVLLMDEAFSALDPLIRTEMQDELLTLQAEQKRTIVFISHDLDEAMRIGDRIAIMQDGVVVQVGTPDDILRNPENDYVRSFFKEVDVSHVYKAKDIAVLNTEHNTNINTDIDTALQQLTAHNLSYSFVMDSENTFQGLVSLALLQQAQNHNVSKQVVGDIVLTDIASVAGDTLLKDLLHTVSQSDYAVPVLDSNKQFLGSIDYKVLLETLSTQI